MSLPIPPDNCDACLAPGHCVTVFPWFVVPDGSGGVLAVYRCPCGHVWSCGWRMDVLGDAA